RYLLTTRSERRSAPAIWRCESPASYLSRSRSLSLRIEIGGADIESPFHGKRKKEMVSLKSPNLQRCRRVIKSETEIRRRLKKCSRWPGFGVHDAPDSVFTMGRIRRSRWAGKCTIDLHRPNGVYIDGKFPSKTSAEAYCPVANSKVKVGSNKTVRLQ